MNDAMLRIPKREAIKIFDALFRLVGVERLSVADAEIQFKLAGMDLFEIDKEVKAYLMQEISRVTV